MCHSAEMIVSRRACTEKNLSRQYLYCRHKNREKYEHMALNVAYNLESDITCNVDLFAQNDISLQSEANMFKLTLSLSQSDTITILLVHETTIVLI